ncbi:hypothetical protein [Priestia sp. GS2]|uniref:hypothetical protein n=1 Tax=Priestia sp. GS2 TaxID=3117403 RepID=UPI002ED9E685
MNLFYFNQENYTGNHMHVDNWQEENIKYLEGIALERRDGTMDLFFQEVHLLSNTMKQKGYIHETFGIFLGNAKSPEGVWNLFSQWLQNNHLNNHL